jgi:prepilin-type N-terminal cleavage/methylation domain-containing protein
MMNRRTHKHSRAFTLLEIMVALALFSIIVLAIYSTWNSILKGKKVAENAAASAQRMRITMRTLKDSLLCTCMFNANASYYWFSGEADGDFASLSFVARLPESFPRSGSFGDRAIVRRLTYAVEPGPNSQNQLVLRQNPLLQDPPDKDEMQNPLILARNVKQFIVEYIDPQSGDWISQWTYTNQLPREVRVTVGLGNHDQFSNKAEEAMVETVALPAQAVPLMVQMPRGPAGGAPPPGGQPANTQPVGAGGNPQTGVAPQ